MDKRNVGKILFWESAIIALLALVIGIVAGIGLSKLFELAMVNILGGRGQL